VRHFVLVYDQREGRLMAPLEAFDDSVLGMKRRFVMLSASSEEQIRSTHSRYFKTLGELVADLKA
jgi:hypothetical protein